MITILLNAKHIVLGLMVIILTSGLILSFLNKKTVSMHDMVHTTSKKLPIFLLAGIIISCCLFGSSYIVNQKRYHSFTIHLNYAEASNGLNPDGTRFNASQFIGNDVLQSVLDTRKYNISEDDLRNCIYISSSYDSSAISETNPKIATTYTIAFSNNILNYDVDTEALTQDLADAAQQKFLTEHTENTSILTLNLSDIDELDYPEINDYLTMQANKLKNYLSTYAWDAQTFKEKDGQTFESLNQKITDFTDTELERFGAYVQEKGLSKNAEEFSSLVSYKNRLLKVTYDKDMVDYNDRIDAINMYDAKMASVVLVPTNDNAGEFYMSRTKIGVDYFASDANTAINEATDIQKEIEQNNLINENIGTKTATSANYKKADQMIQNMKEELTELSTQTNDLFESYKEIKRDGYITTTINQYSKMNMLDIKENLLFAFLLMVSIVYTLTAYREFRRVK